MTNNNQNRLFLVSAGQQQKSANTTANDNDIDSQQQQQSSSSLSVDDDFENFWDEEAKNPYRNRIRIGKQYQATVTPLLKKGDSDERKLNELETLTFCPKKSAKVSDAELDHYFKIAKSLNIFASLVETRSLLGRDVTIADLNRIRIKEGLSLSSMLQPTRQPPASNSNIPITPTTSSAANGASPSAACRANSPNSSKLSPIDSNVSPKDPSSQENSNPGSDEKVILNQPLMRALSHFISLHHPRHHDTNCKKLLKETPIDDNSIPPMLRQSSTCSSSRDTKNRSSRSSVKQNQLNNNPLEDNNNKEQIDQDSNSNSANYDEWTREEVELFSKAIDMCGKNFGSIKKNFLPSKSVRGIVEFYYIGYKDSSDSKKKTPAALPESSEACSGPEKSSFNNNGHSGSDNGGSSGSGSSLISNGGKSSKNSGEPSSTTTSVFSDAVGNSNNPSDANNSNLKLSEVQDFVSPVNSPSLMKSQPVNRPINDLKQQKTGSPSPSRQNNMLDSRMAVYNFDDDNNKEDPNTKLECPPRLGSEVRPLKAKPVLPSATPDGDATNSNFGSLKFFMGGQCVLKLNACQDQQEGTDKCHWVQSGDRPNMNARGKKYLKREYLADGIRSNSTPNNSYADEDSRNDVSIDEDSKESINSSSSASQQQQQQHQQILQQHQHQQQMQQHLQQLQQLQQNRPPSNSHNMNANLNQSGMNPSTPPRPMTNPISGQNQSANRSQKRSKSKTNTPKQQQQQQQQQLQQQPLQQSAHPQLISPTMNQFNGLTGNNQMMNMNHQNESNLMNSIPSNPMQLNPWLQANTIAMAAALLGGIPGFPTSPMVPGNHMPSFESVNNQAVDMCTRANDPIRGKPPSN